VTNGMGITGLSTKAQEWLACPFPFNKNPIKTQERGTV
jgi:hypothetical protein